MKWIGRILALVVLIWLGWWVWQRVFVTDEQRVQRLLSTMTSAVEHGKLIQLEGCIAGDYSDDFGFDKSTILGGVAQFRSQYETIFIHLSDLTITVDSDHQKAQAVFIAKILAAPKAGVTDSPLHQDRFRVYFRKTDDGWKMYRTESPQLKFE